MSGNRYLSDARLAALAASAEAKRVEAARVWAAFTARRRRAEQDTPDQANT